MSITNFTPGPWNAAVFKDEPGAFQIEAVDNKVLCARTRWPTNAQESEANARLIAAAPDLLKACLEVAELADYSHTCGDSDGRCRHCAAISGARAAIRKAGAR